MNKKIVQSKLKKIASYDDSGIGVLNGQLFSLPFSNEESEIIVIPMPWEVTVSYRKGTAQGPQTMADASSQIDLYDEDMEEAWKLGIGMEPISKYWLQKNRILRKKAEFCIDHLAGGGKQTDAKVKKNYDEINAAGEELNQWMEKVSLKLLKAGKSVAVMGGEHSVSLGFMRALTKFYPTYSIIHIDAHADLRKAYEGFEFSHASIQYNASKISNIDQFVLVGIRDYSHQEAHRIAESKGRIIAFPDRLLKRKTYEGVNWKTLCEQMVEPLSKNVYISFDIDALDPSLCPHTGTPVPGGLEFEQIFYLLETLIKTGHKIIGFDLCEVAPHENDDWDSIVGARALYRLCNLMATSQGKLKKSIALKNRI